MAQYDINLREYWRILKKRKAIVVITAIILGFFSTSFAILRAPTPIYQSVSSIKFDKETAVEGLYARTLSWSGSDDMETQISIIKSYSVFEKVAQKMGLIPNRAIKEGHLKSNIIRIVIGLQSKVEVTREKFTNILNIQVEDESPSFAQKLANTIALTYKELHAERQMKRTVEALKYIKEQLEDVQQKLKESEEAFNRFSQDNQLISIDLQSENLLMKSQQTQDELRKIQKHIMELENISERLTEFIKDPSGSSNEFYSEKINSRYQAASAALMELQLKKDTLLEDYTPQHPEVIAISRSIIENARKMLILLRVEIRDSEIKEIDVLNELRDIRNKTDLLMERKIEFDRRKRRVEYYRNMTSLLEEKNQEALIRKAEKPEEITMVRPALLPTAPINPPKTATTGAIGFIIGVILGLVAALVVETFDTSLGAIEDVEQTIGAPVLGVIPFLDAKQLHQSLKEKFPDGVDDLPSIIKSPQIISHFAPMSVIAESFRALRTGIQFKEADHSIKSIAITSASPQEGKTFVSINFSITMAQAGIKVLLVGADMRKPMLSKALGLESAPGLSDILLGSYTWPHSIKTITDIIMGKIGLDGAMITPGLDNLHIITSGAIPPNPAELIESKGIGEFVKEAEEAYDIVIFDAPPILSTADAAIISSKTDGVLLVYRVGAVSRGLLKRSAIQLEQAKSKILGVVLNGMRPEISPDFHDFRYYKYDYAYGQRAEEKKHHKLFKVRGGASEREKKPKDQGEGKTVITGADKEGSGRWKITAGIAAMVLLGFGLLWQNGFITPFKSKEMKRPVIKERIETGPTPASSSTPPNKALISVKPDRGPKKTAAPSLKKRSEKIQERPVKYGQRKGSESRVAHPPIALFEEDGEGTQIKTEVSAKEKGLARTPKGSPSRAENPSETHEKYLSRPEHEVASEVGSRLRGKPKNASSKSMVTKRHQDVVKEDRKSKTRDSSVSKAEAGTSVDRETVQTDQRPSSLKRIAARFWKRTVTDIKTSIPVGKHESPTKKKVAGSQKPVQKMQNTFTSKKGPLKTDQSPENDLKAPTLPVKKASNAIEGERVDTSKVAAGAKEVQSQRSDDLIPLANETLMLKGGVVDRKKTVQSQYKTFSPLIIIPKTSKKRGKDQRSAIPKITLASTSTGPAEKFQRVEAGVRAATYISDSSDQKTSYPYSLYLGSFRSEERAKKAIALYRSNGFTPYRVKVEFKEKGVWFRIYGGYFTDIEEADAFRKRYQLWEAEIRRTNYANLVGIYTNDKALEDKISSLESMGFSPYVIKEDNGESSLFIGAYITLEGAEQQYQNLLSQGISVQVVKR